MQPTKREGRRPARPAAWAVFAVLCALVLASGPASAQIDIGDRWILLTGKWSPETPDAPAWFDLSTWTLAVQMEGAPPRAVSELPPGPCVPSELPPGPCFPSELPPGPCFPSELPPGPCFPVAGDFDGDGVDTVMMFDPATWRLVRLEDGPVEGAADPEPVPWVPVAGDWDGRGIDTVRVFDLRDGSLHRLEEGPIQVEHYVPDPRAARPLVGDFTGRGFDTVALSRDGETGPNSEWVQVAGDWDGDRVDTFGAVHVQSGKLVAGTPVAPASRAAAVSTSATQGVGSIADFGTGGNCWSFTKNYHESVKGGSCWFIVLRYWEEWTCCSLTSALKGPAICSRKYKFDQEDHFTDC